jgi:arylsulfatase A-like enzyme
MNTVLVVIDTLRYDHVGACGNRWVQTPNLDGIAAESYAFPPTGGSSR